MRNGTAAESSKKITDTEVNDMDSESGTHMDPYEDDEEDSEDIDKQLESLREKIKDFRSNDIERNLPHFDFDDIESRDYREVCGRITMAVRSFDNIASFTVETGKKTIPVFTDSYTKKLVVSCESRSFICSVGYNVGNHYYAEIICSKVFFDMFHNIKSISEKLKYMKVFLKLSSDQQENIKNQLSGRKYEINLDTDGWFRSFEELKLKYEICRETYTSEQQRNIDDLFSECNGFSKSGAKSLIKLRYILNIAPLKKVNRLNFNKSNIMSVLDKRLYKMDKVKNEIAEAIIASKYSNNYGLRILLVGSPGTGKTTIIHSIAEACNLPYDIIHLNGVDTPLWLKGSDSSYDNSDAGKIVKTFYQFKTSQIVLGMDEIDKMAPKGKEGNPADCLLEMLSDEHVFYDAFLETPIDVSQTVFIATANSIVNIPDFLLNRFKIINIDDYCDEDKVTIAQNYVIPDLFRLYGISPEEITFSDEVLLYISKEYCSDNGVRMLKDNIHSIIRSVICTWDETNNRTQVTVDRALVNRKLKPIADVNDSKLIYHRNKERYSEIVRKEIEKEFSLLQNPNIDSKNKEDTVKKLKYLTAVIPENGNFETFSKRIFNECVDSTHYGMKNVKSTVSKSFNALALKKKSFSSERILLVGGPGVGKSSICKSIAKGLNLPYIKISLNGLDDTHVIKGFSPSWSGSDAGIIVKELFKAGTTKVLIQLDEIDKLGNKNGVDTSNVLIDLLDNSSEFLDDFLGVPIDLTGALFVATANNISHLTPWLLDRFSVIMLDGYTASEKSEIIDKYLVPRMESEYSESDIRFDITDEAKECLLHDYCLSAGVRDVEKALKEISESKLYEDVTENQVHIDKEDVVEILGPKPIPRGNLLKKNVPGYAKGLAVSGDNTGMAFSVESVVIPGEKSTCITGLPKESTVDSVKLAKSYIRTNYMTEDFGLHLHFGEGAVVKDGPSAGVAITISELSAVFNIPVEGNYAYSGEIDIYGNVFAVGGIKLKIQGAERSGCEKVFIPIDNYNQLSEEEIRQFSIEIVPVENVCEVITQVLPEICNNVKH